jgi:hypothetical protein
MKYAVYATKRIQIPENVRAYLKRKASLRKKPGTKEYKAERARMRRLRALTA